MKFHPCLCAVVIAAHAIPSIAWAQCPPAASTTHLLIPTGANPLQLASGDLDADGDLDLITANQNGQSFSVLRNNGAGGFAPATDYALGADGRALALADIDDDDDLDLLIATTSLSLQHRLRVFRNDGTGVFAQTSSLTTTGVSGGIVAADMDGDKDLDALVVTSGGTGDASVYLNNGSGTFELLDAFFVGPSPRRIAVGDLDNDGDLDVAVSSNATTPVGRAVTIVLNDGSGALLSDKLVSISLDARPRDLAITDIDGDGDLDVAMACARNSFDRRQYGLWILPNTGDATFGPATAYAESRFADSIVATDVDDDGDADVVLGASASVSTSNVVTLVLNGGDGVMSTAVNFNAGNSPAHLAVGDFDADGAVDIAAVADIQSEVHLVRNITSYPFAATVPRPVAARPVAPVLADIDNDADLDLIVPHRTFGGAGVVAVALNDGTGAFGTEIPYAAGDDPYGVAAAHINNDDLLDLVVVGAGSTVRLLFNAGGGTFAAPQAVTVGDSVPPGMGPSRPATGDLDADGDIDIVVTQSWGTAMCVLLNGGNGVFGVPMMYPLGPQPGRVTLANVDADSDLDAVVAGVGDSIIRIFSNNGAGGFSPAGTLTGTTDSVVLADIDADNDNDLLFYTGGNGLLTVKFNSGAGTFPNGATTPVFGAMTLAAAVDIDNDADLDLAFSGSTTTDTAGPSHPSTTVVLYNSGAGAFVNSWGIDGPSGGTFLALGDVDSDLDTDIVVGAFDSATTRLLRNLALDVEACCPADFNDDGTVNSTDVSDFINAWFQDQLDGTLITDWDDNGVVNSTDVSAFINAWFEDQTACGS